MAQMVMHPPKKKYSPLRQSLAMKYPIAEPKLSVIPDHASTVPQFIGLLCDGQRSIEGFIAVDHLIVDLALLAKTAKCSVG